MRYEIAERTVFSFGGGQSDDNYELVEGTNWWRHEIPSQEEFDEGIKNLEAVGNNIDIVVTYEPPSRMKDFLVGSADKNHIGSYLGEIYDKIEFKDWYFGKLHLNKLIPTKYHAVYDNILVADDTKIKNKKEPKPPK